MTISNPHGQTQYQLPAPTLTVPTEPEDCFPMARDDWRRIRRCVDAIKDPSHWAGGLGWAMVGVAATSALTIIPWKAAYDQMAPDVKRDYGAVTGVLIATAIFATALAVVCAVFQHTNKGALTMRVRDVLNDMDEVYAPHRLDSDRHETKDPVLTPTGTPVQPQSGGDLVVEDAWWGSDTQGIDVTSVVRKHVSKGRLRIKANNRVLGDPHENVHKRLRVKYRLGRAGKTQQAVFDETNWRDPSEPWVELP